MSEYQRKMETKLWAIADELRGNMDANEFKNYMLGFIFYKYLSEKIEIYLNNELKEDGVEFKEAYKNKELHEIVEVEAIENLGYFLEPKCLFENLIKKAKKGEFILDNLQKALKQIENSTMGHESEEDFMNLFEDVDLESSKLGKSEDDKNKIISKVLLHLNEIDFKLGDTEHDILGDAYEYLISQFASSAGKKAGEFYTPQQVSKILAKIVTMGKNNLKNVYDPTCGSGSLLLRVSKEAKIGDFYGQELNQSTYNLARMNMILHDVKFNDFNLEQGDSIENPMHFGMKFEAIVANPPFSANWSSDQTFMDDERFSAYGKLAPKSKADFAFVQHMIFHLDENGTMAIVLPHGVLFRGAAEGVIRKYLVEDKNYLDAVIGLPANVFYGTSIPTVILVFKKCREEDTDVLFIDASNYFEKIKNQNRLRDEDIERIVNVYKKRGEIDKFSHLATLDEIRENDYNLNIPRYVDTFEEEETVDLKTVVSELESIEQEIHTIDAEIKEYCDELGIEAPILRRL
ncbi:type I restriction-modification system subunit M [Methanobacterium sp. SMA-27]|uniref:type I restriction-modification system subunit M n=1 Tax=Methanobacterium sp. SMA-27 TaxID=1495336 RepID=UPI00064FF1A9|nr:type I restriction-modification system subunit M [Methanobacterium sp. SMA-27]